MMASHFLSFVDHNNMRLMKQKKAVVYQRCIVKMGTLLYLIFQINALAGWVSCYRRASEARCMVRWLSLYLFVWWQMMLKYEIHDE